MYPKFNFYCCYPQFNHMHQPKYFDWVKDGTGEINFWVDDYIKQQPNNKDGLADMAMLIEPRTIQPTIYEYIEKHHNDFNVIFTHDEKILSYKNARPIYFMNWYKTYDVPKTKSISMVCSDKVMCREHKQRQILADILGSKIDHYGKYRGGSYCDYYECRAEYMFEIVVDNNWSGYWISEKLANPLASKTIPIYLGSKHFPPDFDMDGIICVNSVDEIPSIVDKILQNPSDEYYRRIRAVEHNYEIIKNYQVFEDWFFNKYHDLLESYTSLSIISNNCIGGAMMHDLKIKYQSPTISIQILPEEFTKFCKNINDYMKLPVVEYKPENFSDDHKKYVIKMFNGIPDMPYGLCGDIIICFQHYPTFESGKDMWERRRKRFDKDHVAFMFYLRGADYTEELNEFVSCNFPKSVVFTESFDVKIPIEHYKITPPEANLFLDLDQNGRRYYEKQFNPSKWIKKIRGN